VFSCSKIEQKQLNTWVSFQSAEQPLLGQFSVSGNTSVSDGRGLALIPCDMSFGLADSPIYHFVRTKKRAPLTRPYLLLAETCPSRQAAFGRLATV